MGKPIRLLKSFFFHLKWQHWNSETLTYNKAGLELSNCQISYKYFLLKHTIPVWDKITVIRECNCSDLQQHLYFSDFCLSHFLLLCYVYQWVSIYLHQFYLSISIIVLILSIVSVSSDYSLHISTCKKSVTYNIQIDKLPY